MPVNPNIKMEFRFSDDADKNERMNRVLEIIGNYPSGISFNSLATLAVSYVSRSTMEKWLEDFEAVKAIESSTARRGQRRIIRTSDQYKKWLHVLEEYEIEIGRIKKKIGELREFSRKKKLTVIKFYEIYRLQTDMMQTPFRSYIDGLKYSKEVATLLRDSAGKALQPLYDDLSKIMIGQIENYDFNYVEIFQNLHIIMSSSPYLMLLKEDGKAKENYDYLKKTIGTAVRKLKRCF